MLRSFLGLEPELFATFKKVAMGVFLAIVVGKFLGGHVLALVAIVGLQAATSRKPGVAVIATMLITFLTNLADQLVSHGGSIMMFNKLASMALLFGLLTCAKGKGQGLPLGTMYGYLGVAAISSAQGWCPPVSYLKLLQFIVFLVTIVQMEKILQQSDQALVQVRMAFLVFSIIILLGSAATLFIPGIGYSMYNRHAFDGQSITFDELGSFSLFSGVGLHSQALAPMLACFNAWVLCDMLFVQKKMTRLHLAMLAVAPILLYKTHSRTGLVAYVGSLGIIGFVLLPKAKIARMFRNRVRQIMYGGLFVLMAVAAIMEVRNHTISAWIRKQDESVVESDERGMMEALTASRQGSNEQNLYDFHQNMVLGKGFQTMEWHAAAYKAGRLSFWSAPIEKGVMPLMILGETGVVGAAAFLVFLFCFYSACLARRYVATLALFTTVLVANLGEASFFSPTATGGVILLVALVGGYAIDLTTLRNFDPNRRFQFRMPWGRPVAWGGGPMPYAGGPLPPGGRPLPPRGRPGPGLRRPRR